MNNVKVKIRSSQEEQFPSDYPQKAKPNSDETKVEQDMGTNIEAQVIKISKGDGTGTGAKRAEEKESVVVERASVELAKRLGRAKKTNAEEVKRANAEDVANKLCRPKLG